MKKLIYILFFSCWGVLAFSQTKQVPNPEQVHESTDVNEQSEAKVYETQKPFKLYIPNAFTPNGDGINDTYQLQAWNFSEFEFSVFNRWGAMVYTANNPEFEWNALSQGRKVLPGVYVFVLRGVTKDGHKISQSGSISVIY